MLYELPIGGRSVILLWWFEIPPGFLDTTWQICCLIFAAHPVDRRICDG